MKKEINVPDKEKVRKVKKHGRYTARFLLALVSYAILGVAAIFVVRRNPEMPLRFVLLLLPLIPGMYFAYIISQQISESDELQRRIQVEALALAAVGTALVALTFGWLDYGGVPQLNGYWYVGIMIFLWGVGQFIANRKYQ